MIDKIFSLLLIVVVVLTFSANMGGADAIDIEPKVPPYSLPLSIDQISNYREFTSSIPIEGQAVSLLRANGFLVVENPFYPDEEQITGPYERLKDDGIPLFITADSLLHIYHIQFDETLRGLEEEFFYNDLWQLSSAMLARAEKDYEGSRGTSQEAARRNVAFFAVGLSLLQPKNDQLCQGDEWECSDWMFEGGNPYFTDAEMKNYTFEVPPQVRSLVETELELIDAHAGFAPSPIFVYQEDYSQYQPRGHYTRSEKLKNYFRAMMWYGQMGFLLKGCDGGCLIPQNDVRIQTLGASMIAQALRENSSAEAAWDRIYNVTSFYVGYSDDLGPYQYSQALDSLFMGKRAGDLTEEDLSRLKVELARQESPQIYGGVGRCVAETPEEADRCLADTAGLRLMGQRFIPDSYLFGNLVAPKAGDYTGADEAFTLGEFGRHFPRGLDVMLLLGSSRASEILDELGDSKYQNYSQQMEMLRAEITGLSEEGRRKNLYWAWLYSLEPLLKIFGPGYPTFMQTSAWQDKELTTALASWTELRHDTVLYAKQSYAPEGAAHGPGETPEPLVGYVEPVPEFYERLGNLTVLTEERLKKEDLLDLRSQGRLDALEEILGRLDEISRAELENRRLDEVDYKFIKNFGSEIEWTIADVEEDSKRTTVVADVHTDSNTRQVLEEGVGYVRLMAVAYRVPDGRILLGAGPVFSYYEFKQPMSDRLTDEAWRDMLRENPPAGPEWVCNYAGWCNTSVSLPPDEGSSGWGLLNSG